MQIAKTLIEATVLIILLTNQLSIVKRRIPPTMWKWYPLFLSFSCLPMKVSRVVLHQSSGSFFSLRSYLLLLVGNILHFQLYVLFQYNLFYRGDKGYWTLWPVIARDDDSKQKTGCQAVCVFLREDTNKVWNRSRITKGKIKQSTKQSWTPFSQPGDNLPDNNSDGCDEGIVLTFVMPFNANACGHNHDPPLLWEVDIPPHWPDNSLDVWCYQSHWWNSRPKRTGHVILLLKKRASWVQLFEKCSDLDCVPLEAAWSVKSYNYRVFIPEYDSA